jgi:glycosyltransferase involved in cell wall biosynthesis
MHDVLFNDFRSLFSWQYRFSRNFLFRRSIKQAALKTTVSAYSAGRISRHFDIPENQLHVIPNGISSAFGNGLSVERARDLVSEKYGIRNFILCVSRIEPRKNHLLLLDKFLELELYRQNISLVFIGHPSLQVTGLQKKIDRLTPEQKPFFHLINQVSQEDLEAFYQSCRVFVYPSGAEGFGIPPLEAAVCKVPVLCSNTTAMNDFVFLNHSLLTPPMLLNLNTN